MISIRDMLEVMEEIAPSHLAETWDNPGLHVGDPEWSVKLIWIALDPTLQVIESAADNNVDLIITHHPLIFRPLYSIHPGNPVGRRIEVALKNQLAIMCAHTNLDSACGGVNDMLAEKVGLESIEVMKRVEEPRYKAVVYVPKGHEEEVLAGLFDSGLGKGEQYACVSFRSEGVGTFLPGETAHPFLQPKEGDLAQVPEYRIEIGVNGSDLSTLRQVLVRTHPYEETVCDLYSLPGRTTSNGLGRIGTLSEPTSLSRFVEMIKKVFALPVVKTAGNAGRTIRRAAVCSGSGRSLVGDFLKSDADVMISGDIGYHDGQRVVDAGKSLIDIGHFSSEQVMVEGLSRRLAACLQSRQWEVEVVPFAGESDCFIYV